MRRSSKIALAVFTVVLLAGGWAAYYAQDKGFTHRWRHIVTKEFTKRGVHATIRRLNLDPMRGLIAKDVLVYEDPGHTTPLMRISQIALDVDISELGRREFTLRAFEIRNATITIPLDPEQPSRGESLVLEDFSARVLMPPDQIEIVRAEATVHGILVALSGSLFRPPAGANLPGEGWTGSTQAARLKAMRERREQIVRFLHPLEEVRFEDGAKPKLEIQVQGDTANLPGVRLTGTLQSGPFTFRSYRSRSLAAKVRYERETILIQEFVHEDHHGKLQAEMELDLPDKDLRFQMTSTADLAAFVKTLHPMPLLAELVFYEPPMIEASGTWHLDAPFSWEHLPLEVLGRFRAERATSRGVIFEAISADFSADGDQFYLRNGKLEHKTGVLTCDFLKDPDGVRLQGDVRLHPTIFAPFLASEGSRQFLKCWDLSDQSAVFIRVEGHGPTLSPRSWVTTGVADLRDCRLNGHPVQQLQCDLHFEGQHHNFYNVTIRRPEGEVTGEHIRLDHATQLCTFRNVRGRVFPNHAVAWFAPDAAQSLLIYEFETPPRLSIEGTLDFRPSSEFAASPPRHDYAIVFEGDSSARCDVLGQELELLQPSGSVLIQGASVTLRDFRAETLGGLVNADVVMKDIFRKPTYEISVSAAQLDFEELVRTYGSQQETSGILSGNVRLTMDAGASQSLAGEGSATLDGGNIFCLPTFGPLSKILAATLPKLHDGFNVARRADVRFRIGQGRLTVEAFDAETAALQIRGNGNVALDQTSVDLETRVNVKGPAGALLVPVAKLLEYEAKGTLADPQWRSKSLARVKDATLDNLTETTAGALRRVGEALPKRIPAGDSGTETPPPGLRRPDANRAGPR